ASSPAPAGPSLRLTHVRACRLARGQRPPLRWGPCSRPRPKLADDLRPRDTSARRQVGPPPGPRVCWAAGNGAAGDSAAMEQQLNRPAIPPAPPAGDAGSFGRILVDQGLVTEAQL